MSELSLSEISARLRTQDNRITQNPMFCVQQKRRVVGLDPRWTDNTIWYHNGEKVDEECEGAIKVGVLDLWETVMVAFTEEGCKEYLRQNAHNLREPRIYVESFNRCPEMILLRHWLENRDVQGSTMDRLLTHCQKFIAAQEIISPETVHQTDRVIENAYEFIEVVCNIVGYHKSED